MKILLTTGKKGMKRRAATPGTKRWRETLRRRLKPNVRYREYRGNPTKGGGSLLRALVKPESAWHERAPVGRAWVANSKTQRYELSSLRRNKVLCSRASSTKEWQARYALL